MDAGRQDEERDREDRDARSRIVSGVGRRATSSATTIRNAAEEQGAPTTTAGIGPIITACGHDRAARAAGCG